MTTGAPAGFVHALSESELGVGELQQVEIDGDIRVLAKLDTGEVRALAGICTHEDAELADGDLEGDTLWCPFHAAGFNIYTGAATCLPATVALRRYEVQILDGEIYVSQQPLAEAKQ